MEFLRGIETFVGTANKQVTKEPCLVFFLVINVAVAGAIGTVNLYDGFSIRDTERLRATTGYDFPGNLSYPIQFTKALYAVKDAAIGSYTVGYLTMDALNGIRIQLVKENENLRCSCRKEFEGK